MGSGQGRIGVGVQSANNHTSPNWTTNLDFSVAYIKYGK